MPCVVKGHGLLVGRLPSAGGVESIQGAAGDPLMVDAGGAVTEGVVAARRGGRDRVDEGKAALGNDHHLECG